MPIKLTYGAVREGRLTMAIAKLANEKFPAKLGYDVLKLKKALVQEINTAQELFMKLLKQYAKLNEQGEIDPIHGPNTFEIRDEAKEEWNKELKNFEAIEFEVPVNPLRLDAVPTLTISANELEALEPVLASTDAPALQAVK